MPRLHGFHRFLPHLWELFIALLAMPASRVVCDPVWELSAGLGWQFCTMIGGLSKFLGIALNGAEDGPARSVGLPSPLALALPCGPHNRNDPDFLSSLPILLNRYGRRIRYYPHSRLVESLVAPPPCTLPPRLSR